MSTAAERWRDDLASWAIPDEILAAVPQSPWIHPVEMFVVGDTVPDSPSHQRAREAVPLGGSVLDVGCGGGRAAMALVPPAAHLVGVDHQQGMLDRFAEAALRLGVTSAEVLGDWPDVSPATPTADVVVCHHVLYNVADLPPFLHALTAHATRRVVVEIPMVHPLTHMAPLWRDFWGIERPSRPTADDALAVARDAGIDAHLERWVDAPFETRTAITPEQQARFMRVRLCLTEDREPDIAAALESYGPSAPRETATIWWDV
jgi:SAM-dependent methyltransferase